jgi:hypothetical protein
MQTDTAPTTPPLATESAYAGLLEGYRFRVCATAAEAAEAIAVRDRVYRETGYEIACPDDYDHRSWILRAEEIDTGRCVGTMRLTPRFAGPFEMEEYFELPGYLRTARCVEISRFAILPEHRRDKTPIPAVAFGLFRLCFDVIKAVGGQMGVLCTKPSRAMTYTMLGYQPTGITAAYGKLNGAEHEVFFGDIPRAPELLAEHALGREILLEARFPQVIVPTKRPPLGLVPDTHEFRFAVGA